MTSPSEFAEVVTVDPSVRVVVYDSVYEISEPSESYVVMMSLPSPSLTVSTTVPETSVDVVVVTPVKSSVVTVVVVP